MNRRDIVRVQRLHELIKLGQEQIEEKNRIAEEARNKQELQQKYIKENVTGIKDESIATLIISSIKCAACDKPINFCSCDK
jgi:hypothetical protein